MKRKVFKLELDRETDGRWIAEIRGVRGAMAYGHSKGEAAARAQAIALRSLADDLEEHADQGIAPTITIDFGGSDE